MSVLTAEDLRDWIGRTAQDPYGEPLGAIVGSMHDVATGSPEWLVVAPDGDEAEGVLVPLGGALATGRRIRVVPTAEAVRAAPRIRVGDELSAEAKRAAAAHYGLALDREASASGQLRAPAALRPGTVAEPADAPPPAGTPQQRAAVVQALRAAHAMEQASLKLLAAMRWRAHDARGRGRRRAHRPELVSRPTDVEISRALNALATTLRDQRPPRLEPARMQQIVDGALAGEPKLAYRANGPHAGELRTREDPQLVATIKLRDGRWSVERKLHAGESSWALQQPAHDERS
jgi:hypothetical protein